jgi:hypothetical protein
MSSSTSQAASQYGNQDPSASVGRRSFVRTAAVAAGGSFLTAKGGLGNVPPANAADEDDGFVTTESGLKYKVLKEGTGAIPSPGQTVKVSTYLKPKIFHLTESDYKGDPSHQIYPTFVVVVVGSLHWMVGRFRLH